jgi:transcriptional regulator
LTTSQLEASLAQNLKTIEANFSAVEKRMQALGK